ncbi:hypothetical protein [Catenulispora subtropica]|uniref:Uncharacterized protein n=1 Tax=Catenulispora subtropica TaxID=450798 RepID=A0ABP5DYV4_9ACTN
MDAWEADEGSGGAADREAVRTAEQTVHDAWLGQLLLAEAESEATMAASTRVRHRVAERVRDAQRSGDLVSLARSQAELEHADRACGRALGEYAEARDQLARELAEWTDATAGRARQAWCDRSSPRGR